MDTTRLLVSAVFAGVIGVLLALDVGPFVDAPGPDVLVVAPLAIIMGAYLYRQPDAYRSASLGLYTSSLLILLLPVSWGIMWLFGIGTAQDVSSGFLFLLIGGIVSVVVAIVLAAVGRHVDGKSSSR